jgi:uncharacterized protein (DUF4415 family)
MNKSSTFKTSKTQWDRVKKMKDKDILLSAEHPEGDLNHIIKGIVRKGLKPTPPKASISLRVDRDVLDWFKSQGTGYQSRMTAVLKAFKEASLL